MKQKKFLKLLFDELQETRRVQDLLMQQILGSEGFEVDAGSEGETLSELQKQSQYEAVCEFIDGLDSQKREKKYRKLKKKNKKLFNENKDLRRREKKRKKRSKQEERRKVMADMERIATYAKALEPLVRFCQNNKNLLSSKNGDKFVECEVVDDER